MSKSFTKELNIFKNEVDADISKAVKFISTECYNRIVGRTPVDTGAAKISWELDVKSYVGIIESNCKYIEKLENGFSMKAPCGMVAITLAELSILYKEL